MPKEKFLIKNPSQLQVFLSLFSSALSGCCAARIDSIPSIKELVARADNIAVEAVERFSDHIPGQEDIEIAGQGEIIVDITQAKKPTNGGKPE